MQDIYELFDKVGNSYIVKDDSTFFKFIDQAIYNADPVGTAYFSGIKNQISFKDNELKDIVVNLKRIQDSKNLEEKLASGNPYIDKEGNLRFGIQAELYKRVISTALWEKGMFKPEGLRANALFEFKKLVYDGKGIDPTFKEEFLKRLNINISHARRTGRVKGKKTEEILERKYIRVLDVLERYCNNSG